DQWDPEFLKAIPIMKTRMAVKFGCVTVMDMWDRDEPTVEACIAVCSARIICIAAVPGLKGRELHGRPGHAAIFQRVVHPSESGRFVEYRPGGLSELSVARHRRWVVGKETIHLFIIPVSKFTKMVPVGGKLWCGSQNRVLIINTTTLVQEVGTDSSRCVTCMVAYGQGVWLALQGSAQVRLYHAQTLESLTEVDVAPAVHKMLAGADAIIRQHKAACLRITALLACKDLLWIGTSAGSTTLEVQ
ncbi:hypothetical protein XENOCAPTIV_024264, partial [Xenoophorus captivus]